MSTITFEHVVNGNPIHVDERVRTWGVLWEDNDDDWALKRKVLMNAYVQFSLMRQKPAASSGAIKRGRRQPEDPAQETCDVSPFQTELPSWLREKKNKAKHGLAVSNKKKEKLAEVHAIQSITSRGQKAGDRELGA